jgi:hypothetical protein
MKYVRLSRPAVVAGLVDPNVVKAAAKALTTAQISGDQTAIAKAAADLRSAEQGIDLSRGGLMDPVAKGASDGVTPVDVLTGINPIASIGVNATGNTSTVNQIANENIAAAADAAKTTVKKAAESGLFGVLGMLGSDSGPGGLVVPIPWYVKAGIGVVLVGAVVLGVKAYMPRSR